MQRELRTQRAVWAAVTRRPRASITSIAQALDLSVATVHRELYALKAAGYIDFEKGAVRARTVLVPFVITKKAKR